MAHPPQSAQEVSTRLRTTGYLPDEGLSTIAAEIIAAQWGGGGGCLTRVDGRIHHEQHGA